MPETTTPEVRIFCICGQKMKVTETMFGRPGKCIACRQKIRVPRLDEVPPEGGAIYLKDHPELLRKPSRKSKSAEELAEAVEDADDLALGDPDSAIDATPLDVLDALQQLWSFDQKIRRQLEKVRSAKKGSPEANEKATLLGYRTLVRNARNDLDEQLRKLAGETADEMTTVREKLTRANMAVRVGEIDYATYLDTVNTLRADRDRLSRRHQNAMGWLAVADAGMAGGYIEVKLDDIPVKAPRLSLPPESRGSGPILDRRLEDLRDALRAREQAERAVAEWERMGHEGALSGEELKDRKVEAEAKGLRAKAAVAFARGRLEQLAQDFDGDTKAVKAHLELLRSRLDAGEMDKATFQTQEVELLRAQSDNTRACQMTREAMKAATVAEVPASRSTFARRLSKPAKEIQGIGLDSYLAWAAAALMIVNIVVPVSRAQSGGNMVVLPLLAAGLFVGAVLLSMVALLPDRRMRGLLLSGIWITACIGGTLLLHHAWYSIDSVGMAMRTSPQWFLAPGVLLLAASAVLIGLSASITLSGVSGYRWAPAAFAALSVAGMALILTDGAGLLRARAVIGAPRITANAEGADPYTVTLGISNAGLRTLWLESRRSPEVPTPVVYMLERKIGGDSWEKAEGLSAINLDGTGWKAAPTSLSRAHLSGGSSLALRYTLAPGTYRAVTTTFGYGDPVHAERVFTLEVPESTATEPLPEADAGETIPAEPMEAEEVVDPAVALPAEPALPALTEVTLQGVVDAPGRDTSFLVSLTAPDGSRTSPQRILVGDVIAGAWKATEYRASSQSLVISDGQQTLLLRSGNTFALPVNDAPAE